MMAQVLEATKDRSLQGHVIQAPYPDEEACGRAAGQPGLLEYSATHKVEE